jgi:hypothetical protein
MVQLWTVCIWFIHHWIVEMTRLNNLFTLVGWFLEARRTVSRISFTRLEIILVFHWLSLCISNSVLNSLCYFFINLVIGWNLFYLLKWILFYPMINLLTYLFWKVPAGYWIFWWHVIEVGSNILLIWSIFQWIIVFIKREFRVLFITNVIKTN